jgi:hypothetical protein
MAKQNAEHLRGMEFLRRRTVAEPRAAVRRLARRRTTILGMGEKRRAGGGAVAESPVERWRERI